MTRKRSRPERDGDQFVALPHAVIESEAYRACTAHARSLLLDIALQFNGSNNGRLVTCDSYLKPLGWKSKDTIYKARAQLIKASLLVVTRQGGLNLPNWHALTWLSLNHDTRMDLSLSQYDKQWRSRYLNSTPEKRRNRRSVNRTIHNPKQSGLRTNPVRQVRDTDQGFSPYHGDFLEGAICTESLIATGKQCKRQLDARQNRPGIRPHLHHCDRWLKSAVELRQGDV